MPPPGFPAQPHRCCHTIVTVVASIEHRRSALEYNYNTYYIILWKHTQNVASELSEILDTLYYSHPLTTQVLAASYHILISIVSGQMGNNIIIIADA